MTLIPPYVARVRPVWCCVGGRSQVTPQQLTLPQWISANSRIMRKLIREGPLGQPDDILKYVDYMESIGNYAQVNTTASVMIYDHEFRRKLAERQRTWGR